MNLTPARIRCLEDYARPERNRAPTSDERWTSRQMNWALENGLLCVGPEIGAHVLSEKGRRVFAEALKR